MNTLDIISQYGFGVINRFYGILPGIVLDNTDEELTGNLQVGISGTSLGPTVEVTAKPLILGGGDYFGFRLPLPRRGSVVSLLFMDGNLSSAYWTYAGWNPGKNPVGFKDGNSWGIVGYSGNGLTVNRDSEGKESLNIKFDGPITIESDSSITLMSPCNTLEPTGDTGFNCLGDSENNGWAVAEKLADRLNLLVAEIESLKQELATHTHTAPPTGGATTPPTVPLVTNITEFQGSTFVDPNNIS